MTSIQVAALIERRKNLEGLWSIFSTHMQNLEAVHLTTICQALSTITLESNQDKQQTEVLFFRAIALWTDDEKFPPIRVSGKEGMDFAKILFASASLVRKGVNIAIADPRFVKFVESVKMYYTQFIAEETAQCMWAAATLGLADKQLIDSLSEACLNLSNRFTRQDVEKCMWAVDALKISDIKLLSCLVQCSVRLSSSAELT
jgi:hypothetical protein